MHDRSVATVAGPGLMLGRRRIGDDQPVYVIAEAGVNHNGQPDRALRMIDAAAEAGADAIKFQIFRAETLTTRDAPTADYQRSSAGSQRVLLEQLELSEHDWRRIREHCRQRGIDFLATPFSLHDLSRLLELDPVAIKIASTDIDHYPLLRDAAASGLPVLLSTGAAELAEVERAVGWFEQFAAVERLVLLHCVSAYPTPIEAANLRAIRTLREHFDRPAGFSDHTVQTETATMAVAAGACVLEKHFTLDRSLPGPDHALSLEPAALRAYVARARQAERARGDGRIAAGELEQDVRRVSRRSVVATRALPAGHALTEADLVAKRPAGGIPPSAWPGLIGRRLRCDVEAGTVLRWEMLK